MHILWRSHGDSDFLVVGIVSVLASFHLGVDLRVPTTSTPTFALRQSKADRSQRGPGRRGLAQHRGRRRLRPLHPLRSSGKTGVLP